MISKITSKYQTTIPAKIRRMLKLNVSDSIEWKMENGKIIIEPVENSFLKHRSTVKTPPGNIRDDIERARDSMVKKYK